MAQIRIGDLVVDAKTGGDAAIVRDVDAQAPDDKWLKRQLDARYRKLVGKQDRVRWISAYSLSVGGMLVAEPLVTVTRKATKDELRHVYAKADEHVRVELEELFPFLRNDKKKYLPMFVEWTTIEQYLLFSILQRAGEDPRKLLRFLADEKSAPQGEDASPAVLDVPEYDISAAADAAPRPGWFAASAMAVEALKRCGAEARPRATGKNDCIP